MKPKQLATLLLLAAIWGASFLFIKLSVLTAEHPGNFPPMTLVGVRIGGAALLLYALLKLRRIAFPWAMSFPLAVLGLINAALPYFLFSWGEQHIESNLAAIYNATTPLFTVILALLIVREERLSGIRSLGVIVGFVGILYLFGDSLRSIGRGTSALHVWGEVACIGAAFCYGLGNMWARRRLKHLQPLQLATGQMLWGTLWTLPVILLIEQPWRTLAPTAAAVGALLLLTLLGTAFAQILYFNLLTQVGATRTAQVTYLLPIFGLFWGWLAGETITPRVIGALVIVLLGVLIVNGAADRVWWRRGGVPASGVEPMRR
jgi:drug/metabolite transporter (DMT)-like permease